MTAPALIAERFTPTTTGLRYAAEMDTPGWIGFPQRYRLRVDVNLDPNYAPQTHAHIDVWSASTLTWNRVASRHSAELPEPIKPSPGYLVRNREIAAGIARELFDYATDLLLQVRP